MSSSQTASGLVPPVRGNAPDSPEEFAALVRSGQRVVVAFPHRGEALRTQNMLRKLPARIIEAGKLVEKVTAFAAGIRADVLDFGFLGNRRGDRAQAGECDII